MYEALVDPDNAMTRFLAGTNLLDSYTRAYTYHWIGSLQAMGQVNRAITADYPMAIAFTQGEETTYVASNITENPVTVNFSDGTKLTVQPGQFNTVVKSRLPSISITSPADNSIFPPGANVVVAADASDIDGTITKVEFFEGANYLGEDTIAPYSYTWMSVAEGEYSLIAKATDDIGQSKTSAPVAISGVTTSVANGGFELGAAGDADNWTENGGIAVMVQRSSESARTGGWSMKFFVDNPTTGFSNGIQQTTAAGSITPGLTYDLELYVKGSMTGAGIVGRYEIIWLDSGGGSVGSSLQSIFPGDINGTTYTRFSRAGLVAPAGADAARISIRLEGPPSPTATLYIDDISLMR